MSGPLMSALLPEPEGVVVAALGLLTVWLSSPSMRLCLAYPCSARAAATVVSWSRTRVFLFWRNQNTVETATATAASPTITKTPATAPLLWKKLYTNSIAEIRKKRGGEIG